MKLPKISLSATVQPSAPNRATPIPVGYWRVAPADLAEAVRDGLDPRVRQEVVEVVPEDVVVLDHAVGGRLERLRVERVRHEADPVVVEVGVLDDHVLRVRARVAEHVLVGVEVLQDRLLRVLLERGGADVVGGVAVAPALGLVEGAALAAECEEPVAAVEGDVDVLGDGVLAGRLAVVGVGVVPEDAVGLEVPDPHVLDRHVLDVGDLDPVVGELPIGSLAFLPSRIVLRGSSWCP